MADVLKRLAGPLALANAAATIYTTPAATTTIIRAIRVVNETATAASFTFSIGVDGAGTRIWYQHSVYLGDEFEWTGNMVLAAAEVIQAFASLATTLTITMSGIESV